MGGGGQTSTSGPAATPEQRALQQAALPQIQGMISANPLKNYAGWMPETVVGTNPFYEAAFKYAPLLAASNPAMNFLWGPSPSAFGGAGVPQVGQGPYGPSTTAPPLPPTLKV